MLPTTQTRVVGVWPDVPAIQRPLSYTVPPGWVLDDGSEPTDRAVVRMGSVVRIELRGRRVRGWVVSLDAEVPDGVALRPLAKLTGYGPDAGMIDLAEWAARRWAGRPSVFLRAATPLRAVTALPRLAQTPRPAQTARPARTARQGAPISATDALSESMVRSAFVGGNTVVRLAPAVDPFPLILAAASYGQALILTPAAGGARRLAASLARAGVGAVHHPDGWAAARAGASVVGSRSAAFAPAPNLAAVVVLDEHDRRYQEQRVPSWNARDVAIERARRAGVPCVLVSPVPSLDALEVATSIVTSRQVERAGWPDTVVIDRRRDPDPMRSGLYSPRLVEALRLPGTAAVVLNRTGRAKLLACTTCSELATCDRCQAALNAPDGDSLVCPRCSAERPPVCAGCGRQRMKLLRPGVSRVREELEALLGESVVEVSAGTEQQPNPARVYVGTSALLYRLGSAETVAFLDLDADLLAPRYRAGEEVLAQLARAARLLGGRRPGAQLVLQTRQAAHPVVQAVVHADPGRYQRPERAARRTLNFPPFSALAALSGPGAAALAETIRAASAEVDVLGPRHDRWLVRAPNHEELSSVLALAGRAGERCRVEVDPPDV